MHGLTTASVAYVPTAAPIETLYATAYSLLEQERLSDAAAVLRVMLHHAPTDERAWLALGACHARRGQRHVALELYGAGAVAARSARCHLARAQVLAEAGRTSDAEAEVERARELDDGDLSCVIDAVARALH